MCRLAYIPHPEAWSDETLVGYMAHLIKVGGGKGNGIAWIDAETGEFKGVKGVAKTPAELLAVIRENQDKMRYGVIFHTRIPSVGRVCDELCMPFVGNKVIYAFNGTWTDWRMAWWALVARGVEMPAPPNVSDAYVMWRVMEDLDPNYVTMGDGVSLFMLEDGVYIYKSGGLLEVGKHPETGAEILGSVIPTFLIPAEHTRRVAGCSLPVRVTETPYEELENARLLSEASYHYTSYTSKKKGKKKKKKEERAEVQEATIAEAEGYEYDDDFAGIASAVVLEGREEDLLYLGPLAFDWSDLEGTSWLVWPNRSIYMGTKVGGFENALWAFNPDYSDPFVICRAIMLAEGEVWFYFDPKEERTFFRSSKWGLPIWMCLEELNPNAVDEFDDADYYITGTLDNPVFHRVNELTVEEREKIIQEAWYSVPETYIREVVIGTGRWTAARAIEEDEGESKVVSISNATTDLVRCHRTYEEVAFWLRLGDTFARDGQKEDAETAYEEARILLEELRGHPVDFGELCDYAASIGLVLTQLDSTEGSDEEKIKKDD